MSDNRGKPEAFRINPYVSLAVSYVRNIPLHELTETIRLMQRAETLGPIIHPGAWLGHVGKIHSANLDVLRRMEDLRRSIIELDEIEAKYNQKEKT